MKINTIASAIATLALALAAGSAHADIKLGLIVPLTGGTAPLGESVRAGARVAVAELNAKGGALGQKLVLVERDDQSKNENGPLFTQELIGSEGIAAAVGFCNTGVALPSLPIFQEHKVPLMVPCTTGVPVTAKLAGPDNYAFRVSAPDSLQTAKMVAEAKRRGIAKIGLMTDNTAYGKFGHDELVKAAKAAGVEIVAEESFGIGDKDVAAQLFKEKAAGAEAILAWGIAPELAVIAKDRVKIGFKVPMFASWAAHASNFIEAAGKAGDGLSMPATFLQASATAGRQADFVAAVTKELGKPTIGGSMAAAWGYDAVKLLAAAMEQAKSSDGEKVKLALESLRSPVEGVVMTYKAPFSVDRHEALTAEFLGMGEIRDGKATLLSK